MFFLIFAGLFSTCPTFIRKINCIIQSYVDKNVCIWYNSYLYEKYEFTEDRYLTNGKHVLGMPKGNHIFGTVKVGEKGQIVIPKEARELFGIKPGSTLLVLGNDDKGIIVTKPEVINNIAAEILDENDKGKLNNE